MLAPLRVYSARLGHAYCRPLRTSSSSSVQQLAAPWRVTLDTNPDDCNLACVMCEQHSVHSSAQADRRASGIRKRRMDPSLADSIVSQLAPLGLKEVIPSTMGEPLMYTHFDRIVERVALHPGVRINLTTNGTFPPGPTGRNPEDWARMLLPHISDVKISWNGATAGTHEAIMRHSSFAQQLRNLRTWVRVRDELGGTSGGNRASITLQLTFLARNVREIPAIVELAIAEGVDRVKGHHLWAHFAEIKQDDLRRSPTSIAQWNDCVAACHALAQAKRLPNGNQIRLEHFDALAPTDTSSTAVGVDTECPFLGREAWVNSAGDFAPCCAPDEQRKTLGAFGNVTEPGGLLRIWNSDAYRALVAGYKAKSLCQGCHMRKKV